MQHIPSNMLPNGLLIVPTVVSESARPNAWSSESRDGKGRRNTLFDLSTPFDWALGLPARPKCNLRLFSNFSCTLYEGAFVQGGETLIHQTVF